MAKVFDLKIEGVEKVKEKFKTLTVEPKIALEQGLYEIGTDLINKAKEQCPVDTGTLRSTGHVELPQEEFGVLYVECGFGGFAAPYAIYVHERTELHHKVGKAKFLEDPLKENAYQYHKIIQDILKRLFK